MPLPTTMRAVIFKAPFSVAVEDRPIPKISDPKDAILKVRSTALCGSDLHFYRGHQKIPPEFIVGHEFTGVIEELGSEVKDFKVGDEVVVPFFTACGECFYCEKKQASRCAKGVLFARPAQSPAAKHNTSAFRTPPPPSSTLPKTSPNSLLVLMADIFPTGYFAASRFLKNLSTPDRVSTVVVLIGCGPVGICALVSALTMVKTAYAIDPAVDRLAEAEKLGAIPIKSDQDAAEIIKAATGGRGADFVMEVVGRAAALDKALEIVRPWGQISSVGVHTEALELKGPVLYGKNITLAFGRYPMRSIFEEALAVLVKEQDKVKFLCGKVLKLEEAPEAFKLFEKQAVHKVVFDME